MSEIMAAEQANQTVKKGRGKGAAAEGKGQGKGKGSGTNNKRQKPKGKQLHGCFAAPQPESTQIDPTVYDDFAKEVWSSLAKGEAHVTLERVMREVSSGLWKHRLTVGCRHRCG